jgi:hypothetical protein
MHSTPETTTDEPTAASIVRDYVLDVRIVADGPADDRTLYRFEAPHHGGRTFDDLDVAELYADVYFDVNGFDEEGVGERGVPPEIIQAGRDTLVAYFRAQSYGDINWIASYYGIKPERAERYVARVRKRAARIREGVADRDPP